MQTIYGRPVQISAPYPRVQVSQAFKRLQSPELVAETNAWMVKFFGYAELIADGDVYVLFDRTLVMNQSTYNKAIAALKGQNHG